MELYTDCLQELEKTYCPAVDSALFAAIVSDFDLTVADDVVRLRESLDAIKGLAVEQENLPFDPTGMTNSRFLDTPEIGGLSSDQGTSVHGHESLCTPTDVTSISEEGLGKLTLHSPKSRPQYTVAASGSLEMVGGSQDDKVDSLREMFPTMNRLDIDHTLKKNCGDVDKAMDVLLNISFFDGTNETSDKTGLKISIPKGIDGFNAEGENLSPQSAGKRKKNKKQKSRLGISPAGFQSPLEESPVINKWESGQLDIEFICSRAVDLSREKVTFVYHAKGMHLPSTIRALALAEAPEDIKEISDDPVAVTQVAELSQDYPFIQKTVLVGLLRITHNIISATNELAAMMIRQSQPSANDIIKFTAAPLNLEENDEVVESPRRRGAPSPLNYEDAQAAADAHFAAGSAAYQQASQAARRAKSNPLYGGAAAVYRQRGQEQRELAMQQLATASDRLVDRQSINCDLDLHGVIVTNAIRISRERVEAWWDGLGDRKHIRGGGKHVHGGFKIVTGVGNHSHDGTSRLGPAVSKMLLKEGWQVEVNRGYLVVTGKVRR